MFPIFLPKLAKFAFKRKKIPNIYVSKWKKFTKKLMLILMKFPEVHP